MGVVSRPLQFSAGIRLSKKIRYQNTSSTTTFNLTRGNMLNIIMNGTTSSTCGRLLAAVRLVALEIWTSVPSNGPNTISVEWLSLYGPSTQSSDTTISVSLPAHLRTSPPVASVSSFWSLTGQNESEVLAKIVLPSTSNAMTVVDVSFDCVFMDDETPYSISLSQTVTPNQFYMGYLDGQGSSAQMQPVSYTSIK
jgi:hypothetical protein